MKYRTKILSTLLLTTIGTAQDPVPPPGGFPIRKIADIAITYSDGYRTLLDARLPDIAAPATGWPCAMVVHGGGGNRNRSWVVTVAELLTRAGYVTLAYDTGGNGATQNLNPPGRRLEALRIRDVAEIFYFAKQNLGARMDQRRLAMMGKSGGGKHTLWGASYSGRPLPVGGPLVSTMPVLRAAFTDIQVLDFVTDNLPGGNMIKADWYVKMVSGLPPADPLRQLMLNQNFPGLRANLLSDPGSGFFSLLKQSDVPVFVSYAYDDKNHFVNVNADAIPQLKPGVPNRFFLGTGGHGSTGNGIIGSLRRDYTRRWFDRFLKGINNGVDTEPFAEIAMIANDTTRYQSFQSAWKHRHSRTWPLRPTKRFFLRGGGRLMPNGPAGIEPGGTVKHRVAPGYDGVDFATDEGRVQRVLQSIPSDAVQFQTAVLPAPQELLGRSVVELEVISAGATDFQMQAALLDVPPSGTPRFITSGAAALRQVAPGRHRMRITLGDVGYVVRAGHRLRLSLENLNIKRQPGNVHFYAVPEFHNYDLTVQIDPAYAPRLDLPLKEARASLLPRFGRVRGSASFSYPMRIEGESSRAGQPYLMLLGASGAWPGFNAPPQVPLNIDVFTHIGLSVTNTPFLDAFLGLLDAQGTARPTLRLPAPVSTAVIGMRFNFVASSVSGSGQYSVTNPTELIIEP